MEPLDSETSQSKLHPTTVGRLLCKKYLGKIKNVKSIGINRVKFFTSDRDTANDIVKDPFFKTHNLRFLVPAYRLSRQALIRGVSLELTDDEILSELKIDHPNLVDAERLNRRQSKDFNSKLVPSQTILLTFSGQTLPNRVILCSVIHEISTYVPPVKICFKCYRFGHINTICKGIDICERCGKAAHSDSETCPRKDLDPHCVNCQQNHSSKNKICPEWNLQLKIRTLAATHNISIVDASDHVLKVDPPGHLSRSISSIKNKINSNLVKNSSNNSLVHDPSSFDFKNFSSRSSKSNISFSNIVRQNSSEINHSVHATSPAFSASASASSPSSPSSSQFISSDPQFFSANNKFTPAKPKTRINSKLPNKNLSQTRFDHYNMLVTPNGRSPSPSHSFSSPSDNFTPDNSDTDNDMNNFSFDASDKAGTLSFLEDFFNEFVFPFLKNIGHSNKIQCATYVFRFLKKTILNDDRGSQPY